MTEVHPSQLDIVSQQQLLLTFFFLRKKVEKIESGPLKSNRRTTNFSTELHYPLVDTV